MKSLAELLKNVYPLDLKFSPLMEQMKHLMCVFDLHSIY